MRISDCSSDVFSSDLIGNHNIGPIDLLRPPQYVHGVGLCARLEHPSPDHKTIVMAPPVEIRPQAAHGIQLCMGGPRTISQPRHLPSPASRWGGNGGGDWADV